MSMSGAAGKEPPVVPPKERSPSPDDGLLREEPLELESKTTDTAANTTSVPLTIPTATAPSAAGQTATAPPAPIVDDENPPPKPPRPVSQFEQNVVTLAEAFPDVDMAVIKAVLTASGGRVEPAFNALLSMSDPSAAAELEEAPPPQPPRPRQQQPPRDLRGEDHYNPARVYHEAPTAKTSTSLSQMESDELYARQLAEHYGAVPSQQARQGRGGYGNYPENQRRTEAEEDKEPSFFDDELPVIRENLRKGFIDTQTKFNRFLTDLGKKFNGDEEEEQHQQQQQQQQQRQQGGGPYRQSSQRGPGPYGGPQQYPQRHSSRRPGDAYDADPEVIQGDFSHLELRDNTDEPRRNRPVANPNLFSSGNPAQPSSPGGNGGRRVGFANQSEEDLYRKPTNTSTRSGPAPSALRSGSPGTNAPATKSKWEPLSSVEPTPINNDPFQLADSDDEQDNITTTAAKTGPQESGTKTAGTK